MDVHYSTQEGDMIDEIVYRHYDNHLMLETVLKANPKLVDYGTLLPAGVVIVLPAAVSQIERRVELWS